MSPGELLFGGRVGGDPRSFARNENPRWRSAVAVCWLGLASLPRFVPPALRFGLSHWNVFPPLFFFMCASPLPPAYRCRTPLHLPCLCLARCAPLPLLTPPAPDLSTPRPPDRPHPATRALDGRFLLPEKRSYDLQYAHTYFVRLARLRERAEASARSRWPTCRVGPVLGVGEPGDPPAVVVGTLSKALNARPSVLAQAVAVDPAAAEEALEGSVLFSEPYATPGDKLIVEDVDARVALAKASSGGAKRTRRDREPVDDLDDRGSESEGSGDEGFASDEDGVADALGIPSAGKVLEEALEEQEAQLEGEDMSADDAKPFPTEGTMVAKGAVEADATAAAPAPGSKPRSRLGLAPTSARVSASPGASAPPAASPADSPPPPVADVDSLAFPGGRLVTGVVAALKGRALEDGRVAVQGVCFPGVAPGKRGDFEHLFKQAARVKSEPPSETESTTGPKVEPKVESMVESMAEPKAEFGPSSSASEAEPCHSTSFNPAPPSPPELDAVPCSTSHPPLIAFVSGLEACAADADVRRLSLLADLLTSAVGDGDERTVAGTICKIVVAGDALGYGGDPRPPKKPAKKPQPTKKRQDKDDKPKEDPNSPEAIAKARKADEDAFRAAYNDSALSGWGRRRLLINRQHELRERQEDEERKKKMKEQEEKAEKKRKEQEEEEERKKKKTVGDEAGANPPSKEGAENRCENGDASTPSKARKTTGPIRLTASKATSLPPRRAALLSASAVRADALLSELAEAAPLTLLPGVRDPCPISQPQQPLHPCLFPGLAGFRSVRRAPSMCDEVVDLPADVGGPLRLLGTSGANVADLLRCRSDRGRDDPVSALADLLAYGHLAPTAPDTLACFPFADQDPFVLDEAPDVFFAGNCAKYGTGLVRVSENGRVKRVDEGAAATDGSRLVRLVAVPRFAETGGFVLVNAQTLEATLVTVDLDVDEEERVGRAPPVE